MDWVSYLDSQRDEVFVKLLPMCPEGVSELISALCEEVYC